MVCGYVSVMSKTRWTARAESTNAVWISYEEVKKSLETITEQNLKILIEKPSYQQHRLIENWNLLTLLMLYAYVKCNDNNKTDDRSITST